MYTLRRVLVVGALILAWAFAGNDRAPLTLTVASEAVAAAGRADELSLSKTAYDLSALRVLTKVTIHVKENYVDPKRVNPKEMMVSALEAVEKTVPDVMVDGSVESGKVRVIANGKSKEFDITHVDSLWKMSFTLKDVFDFISKNIRPTEESRDIEYAAINGMLNTLDPHSVLMRPEMYKEMKVTTKGEFGGLGFVIQMREGVLTVVKVLPKTPAFRAGIKKDDQILKIGEESTVNMDLSEAVGKLRGPIDSKVTITVNRKSWEKPASMTVTRALITVESVQSKLLAQNVGYVRIKNFQGNTTKDLQTALGELDRQARNGNSGKDGMKGLVLDLRGNPGGLLDQAIQVSDTFVSNGVIVATVGLSDKLRDEKVAHSDSLDNAYPIVVLVNAGSASASEIVAGALKNLNRAVIVGRQTFGKGSVQVLYDFPDESALKLTIAKYLTPGDISIQEVGITPDIQLIPTRVTKDRVDVFSPRKSMGEADLDHHFGNPGNDSVAKKRDDVVVVEKPAETLKYLKEEKEKDNVAVAKPPEQKVKEGAKDGKDAKKDTELKASSAGGKNPLTDAEAPTAEDIELDDQLDAESQDEVKEDFEVQFARNLLVTSPALTRDAMLKGAKSFISSTRKREEERIASAISSLGVDWTAGETPKKVVLDTVLKPNSEKKSLAGDSIDLELQVENRGSEPIRRLRAWTESENGYLDRREFLYGLIKPGKKSWTVPVKMPKDMLSRRDGVTVKLQDDSGQLYEASTAELNFIEQSRPQFAFNWAVVDNCEVCNSDGMVQRGESVTLYVDVTNTGTGKAQDSFATIRNASDANIFIERGRFKIGEIPPGETRSAKFQLEVKKAYKADSFALKFAVLDEPLEEYSSDKLTIPVSAEEAAPVALDAAKQVVKLAEKADVLASADANGRVLARLPKGAVVQQLAKGTAVSRIEWGDKDRFAFVRNTDVKDAKAAKVAVPAFDAAPSRTPAAISLNVDPTQGGLVVESERFTLSAVVNDPSLLDVFVMVNDQKVFFKTKSAEDPASLKFTSELKLKEGNNLVTVIARQSEDFATRKTVVIRRRPAVVAHKNTVVRNEQN